MVTHICAMNRLAGPMKNFDFVIRLDYDLTQSIKKQRIITEQCRCSD
jgi:hypothetical protein